MVTDETIMPWGAHKGKKMANVPDYYLKWIYENNKCSPEIKAYIEDNAQSLKIQIKK